MSPCSYAIRKTLTLALCAIAAAPAQARLTSDARARAPTKVQDLRVLADTSSLAGTTAGRPGASTNRTGVARYPAAIRAPGSRNKRRYAIAASREPSSAAIVRDAAAAPGAADGFNWGDGAIGAGVTAVLLLTAAGAASVRRPSMTTRRGS